MLIQRLAYITLSIFLIGIVNLNARHSTHDRTFETFQQSFILVNNLIVVEAEISGQKGNFILDTGSSGLLLNSQSSGTKTNVELELIGVGGSTSNVHRKFIKKFQFGSLIKRNFHATCTELKSLESSLQIPIIGLIGMDVLAGADILIDFRAKMITINSSADVDFDADHSLAFTFQHGIPIVSGNIRGVDLNLAFDLGATCTLLDESIASELQLPIVEQINLITADGPTLVADKVRCHEIQLGKSFTFTTNAVVMNLSHLDSEEIEIDGIVGLDFVRSRKVLISPSHQQVLVWNY